MSVDQQVRLKHDVRDRLRKLIDAFKVGSLLDTDRKLVDSCFPHHGKAVAYDTRDREVEHILAEVPAGFLLDELRIAACAACAYDDSLGLDGDLLAIFCGCDHALDCSVFLDQLLRRSLQKELNSHLLCMSIECLVHEGCGSRSDSLIGLNDMPGRLRLREILESAFELDSHVLEPFDGLRGLFKVSLDHTCIHHVVGIGHDHVKCLLHSDVLHVSLLIFGSDSQRAHAHIRSAADGRRLIDHQDIRSVLCCLHCCRKSCGACTDDTNLCGVICHNCFLLW